MSTSVLVPLLITFLSTLFMVVFLTFKKFEHDRLGNLRPSMNLIIILHAVSWCFVFGSYLEIFFVVIPEMPLGPNELHSYFHSQIVLTKSDVVWFVVISSLINLIAIVFLAVRKMRGRVWLGVIIATDLIGLLFTNQILQYIADF
jgi:hypothetical protein